MIDFSKAFDIDNGIQDIFLNQTIDLPGFGSGSLPPEYQGAYLLRTDECSAGLRMRHTGPNPLPAKDGSTQHLRFVDGMQVTFSAYLWQVTSGAGLGQKPACDEPLQMLMDGLDRALQNLRRPDPATGLDGRIIYYCERDDCSRILDGVRLLEGPLWEFDQQREIMGVTFTLDSPFPYWLSITETTSSSWSATITNEGSCPMFPVWKVYGDTDGFTLRNDTYDLEIIYDDDFPGASFISTPNYVEIDTFRETAFLNGSGDNRIAGIDVENSTFWPLFPGDNLIQVSGKGTFAAPTAEMLWNYAWC